jgi:hypothetical protein
VTRGDRTAGLREALAGCAAAGALLWLAGEQAWPLAAGAGIVGILATRTWGRVPVGVALAGCGVGAGAAGLGLDGALRTVTALLGAALLVATGVLIALRGRGWRGLGARYDAPSKPRTDADAWAALDRGEDPTL